jgi:hypothetical protein
VEHIREIAEDTIASDEPKLDIYWKGVKL